jgi:Kelch motif/Galactose oxidase, central domain
VRTSRILTLLGAILLALTTAHCNCGAGSGTFTPTGSMGTARSGHTATLLKSGKVLIAGGSGPRAIPLVSAELYDPATGTFTPTGSLATAHGGHTATLLSDGKVLIAGGADQSSIASAELYDAATATFTPTGSLSTARQVHTATLLSNGMVLIAGGLNPDAQDPQLVSAELYDPATATFTPTGSLSTARQGHTATLLTSGMVLIAGGFNSSWLASAELYDPATGTFTPTGSLASGREGHRATLLTNGKVLIAGGWFWFNSGTQVTWLMSAEVYDPATGTFATTGSLAMARIGHTATLLTGGKLLVAGGFNSGTRLASAELYDPATGTFMTTGSLATARNGHTATLLTNGMVLIAGGLGDDLLASAELYN